MRRIWAVVLLLVSGHAGAAASTLTLQTTLVDRINALPIGASLVIDDFPDGYGDTAALEFRRIDVYAAGARVVLVAAEGERELPRSQRIQLVGKDHEGRTRAVLSFDPGFDHVNGSGIASGRAFAILADRDNGHVTLRSTPLEDTLPAGVTPRILDSDDALPSGQPPLDPLTAALALAQTADVAATRRAVVAVDTDNELMTKRFANNTTSATNWIADLFATMNVMYQRDLNVTLQQGTTYLRTTPDPYNDTSTPANGAALNEFGNYWQNHYASVPRSFAMLLSGKSTTGNSASGIAWVNSYCRTQSQGGSYSVNQVFTNPALGITYSALIVGHELGHNFGAFHTHCTNVSTGAAPVATNTIDRCYAAQSGCYTGPTSCPSSGPGAPAGTIMSYCNGLSCGSGQNVLQFHPVQIGVINGLIAQNTPSCLVPGGDPIFKNGFD